MEFSGNDINIYLHPPLPHLVKAMYISKLKAYLTKKKKMQSGSLEDKKSSPLHSIPQGWAEWEAEESWCRQAFLAPWKSDLGLDFLRPVLVHSWPMPSWCAEHTGPLRTWLSPEAFGGELKLSIGSPVQTQPGAALTAAGAKAPSLKSVEDTG